VLRIVAIVVVALVGVPFAIGFVSGFLDERSASSTISQYVDGDKGVAYESAAGGFTATFPTHPVPEEQTINNANGTTVIVHDMISRPGRKYAFEVGYVDVANGVSFPDARGALAGVVDAMAAAVNGTVTETTRSSLRGIEAEDFVVSFKDRGDDAYAVGRVALDRSRLYLVAVTARHVEREAFNRLVESFQLTSSMG
jgi:hypothetical protein